MTARVPADQAVRDAIRTQLGTTMLVEAAAGTGKTTSLVERMTELVATGTSEASTLAAITFTIKAAAQLREKFQESVEARLRASEDAIVQQRLRSALRGIGRGFIGTTHAFCARLIRERPVEAGLDPEFEEVDQVAAQVLLREFWSAWWASEVATGNPLLGEAAAVGLEGWLLRSAFAKIVEHPDVTFVVTRQARPDLRAVCDQLCSLLDECEPHLPTDADRDQPDDFELMIVALLRLRRSLDLNQLPFQLRFLEEGNHASRKPVQKRWPEGKVAKQLGENYKAFATSALRPALQHWREYVHAIALELLRPAAVAFADERRRSGKLTFQDLLLCARDMLRDHPPVRRYFQRRFTHLLVDEFQDTDPLQAEVMLLLTGGDSEERNWRKLQPLPGSLFIVGDPKQSIYRFRRADITTYLEVKDRIVAGGGTVLQLGTNFRSAPPICAFVNEAFASLFTAVDVDAGRQAAHVDLDAYRESGPPAGVYSLETPHGLVDDMAEVEARCVAGWIGRSVAAGMIIEDEGVRRPVRWSDFLLVSSGRPRLSIYARVFQELAVPYEITGSRAFAGAPELGSVLPLLRAVVDFDDAPAIVAFLRGELCGVDDDALYRFHQEGGRFSPFREHPEGTDSRIVHGLGVLREAIEDSRQHPPAAAIGRLFERLGLFPVAVSGDQAGTRSGALALALTTARDLSARGEPLESIIGVWADLLNAPPDVEELDIDPARADAVRLMNLHQVKGLEAPIVFLIDPSDEFDHPVDLFVDRSGDESRGYFALSKQWGQGTKPLAQPPEWDGHVRTETAFKDAEKKRLLYVAATRAKHLLIIGYRINAGRLRGAWRELAGRASQPLFAPPDTVSQDATSTAAVYPFAAAQTDLASRFEAGRTDSYSVLPITKIAHGSHAELVRAEEGLGKGTSWGRVLHRMFEELLLDEAVDIALLASNLLKDEERDAADLAEVIRVVGTVQRSVLWKRVQASPERFVEVPFALLVPRSEAGLEGEGETLLHGVIDLVFREDRRWFVVDYKSDSTKGRLAALIEYYRPQVQHYTRFWAKLTGAEATGGLFFVDIAQDVWL